MLAVEHSKPEKFPRPSKDVETTDEARHGFHTSTQPACSNIIVLHVIVTNDILELNVIVQGRVFPGRVFHHQTALCILLTRDGNKSGQVDGGKQLQMSEAQLFRSS